MFTKNWYILQSLHMLSDSKQQMTDLKPLDWDGQSKQKYYPYHTNVSIQAAINSVKTDLARYTSGVLFGTGDTPASLDDYKLAGDVIQNINASVYKTYSYSEAQPSLKALYTITNNNEATITIKEVALNLQFDYTSSGSSTGCVIDRTVLDTPVTIPAGGVGQVEYTITFNLPTATTETN